MSDVIIRVDRLSKLYQIGAAQVRHDTLRDALVSRLPKWGRQPKNDRVQPTTGASSAHIQPHSDPTIWALRDVSFEVKQGEVVGIIGRNGAGKSTLLKILSRITEPTSGRVEMHGRVGSLLEVGTGFHPELTGRDNVYLNGAILGMKRSEIERKFDEIIDFAEIEQFLDTPVKRYSSGMYVRLAFAVAAHLEPEILLVDEVLAVGDVAFQKKCLGKMGEVAQGGRTVLFVSHNMGAIAELCPNSILLKAGAIASIGASSKAIRDFLGENQQTHDVSFELATNPHAPVMLTRCWIADAQGQPVIRIDAKDKFYIGLQVMIRRCTSDFEMSVRVFNESAQPLFTTNMSDSLTTEEPWDIGYHSCLVGIPGHFLAPGAYSVSIGIHRPGIEVIDNHENVLIFEIQESGSAMWKYHHKAYGNILVQFPWQPLSRDVAA